MAKFVRPAVFLETLNSEIKAEFLYQLGYASSEEDTRSSEPGGLIFSNMNGSADLSPNPVRTGGSNLQR